MSTKEGRRRAREGTAEPGPNGSGADHEHTHGHGHTHGHAHAHGPEHSHEHGHEHTHAHGHEHDAGSGHTPGLSADRASAEPGLVLTVRAGAGLSGDMMLSGLAGLAGLGDSELNELVLELGLPVLHGCLSLQERSVHHIAGLGCRITLPHEHAHRNLADILKIIEDSAMPEEAKALSAKAFTLLAEAEGAVHGMETQAVTFHEVGALDSILDTCLVCRLYTLIAPARFVCSPLPLADGVIACAHGLVPSPAPAVLRLLEGIPVCGFPGAGETVTPTALSLLKALGADFGPWPAMTVRKTLISYGGKVFANAPNGALWALGEMPPAAREGA